MRERLYHEFVQGLYSDKWWMNEEKGSHHHYSNDLRFDERLWIGATEWRWGVGGLGEWQTLPVERENGREVEE